MTAGPLVHGMGTELVAPDWAPLSDQEVRTVLAHYEGSGDGPGADEEAVITWPSPRPMSAAALVRRHNTTLFVKRHDRRVRTPAQLATEHAFARHLRAGGVPVPAVLNTRAGPSSFAIGAWVYEVHEAAAGLDLYRDAMSWTPFTSLGHAWAAGAALARFHRSAAAFDHPARPPGVLISSCEVITAADPLERVGRLLDAAAGPGPPAGPAAMGRRPDPPPPPRHPSGSTSAEVAGAPMGTWGLAPLQPDLDIGTA